MLAVVLAATMDAPVTNHPRRRTADAGTNTANAATASDYAPLVMSQGRDYLPLWYNAIMSDEPTMKLYSLAAAATRTIDNQTAIGVQSALVLLPEGVNIQDAGLQAARDIFPESEGWADHFATATEIPQGFPLEPYRLTWKIEKG